MHDAATPGLRKRPCKHTIAVRTGDARSSRAMGKVVSRAGIGANSVPHVPNFCKATIGSPMPADSRPHGHSCGSRYEEYLLLVPPARMLPCRTPPPLPTTAAARRAIARSDTMLQRSQAAREIRLALASRPTRSAGPTGNGSQATVLLQPLLGGLLWIVCRWPKRWRCSRCDCSRNRLHLSRLRRCRQNNNRWLRRERPQCRG